MTSTAADGIRDLLYGDASIDRWAPLRHIPTGDPGRARAELHAVLDDPDRPARDHLQAWHALRGLGEESPEPARLYGVVVDMPVDDGLDTLAGYVDGSCRYLNHSGKVLVYEGLGTEGRAGEVDRALRNLLAAGAAVVAQIGPWQGPRPPLPPETMRLSMLCAGGLYFGEGPVEVLSSDPMAGRLLGAATGLLQVLVGLED